MGNRKARELMLHQDQDALWQRIRTEPRPTTRDVLAPGIGLLRMQLIVRPSFEDAMVWDVRHGPNGWCLFRPRVLQSRPDVQLVGYDAVPFPAVRLASYFDRVTALSLPIAPDFSGYSGADGTMHEFAVFGDLYSSWRFRWWSQPPKQWSPLVDIATEILAAFSAIEGIAADGSAET